ncbi:MAG: hypothetical protein M1358_17265 [Chloroflexi bacterium]|nr:hypothetical protein [Chloroflexota bacterium]
MHIRFSERVVSSKREEMGRVVAAIIDTGSLELTHIVSANGVAGQPVYVPVNAIERWTEEEVLLRLEAKELADLPLWAQPKGLRISKDTSIEATDAPIGKVGHVLTDQYTYRVSDFLVHKWPGLEADILVSMTYVTDIEPDLIKLGITKAEALTRGEAPAAFYVPVEGTPPQELPVPVEDQVQPG